MRRNTGYVVLVLVFTVALGTTNLQAEDSLWQRMNPLRFFRNRKEVKASSPSPLQLKSKANKQTGTDRLGQTDFLTPGSAWRQDAQYRARFGEDVTDLPPRNPEPRRARFESHRANPAADQQRAARREQAQLNGGPLSGRTTEGQPPTLEELRAHLESRGIEPARIEALIQHADAAGQSGNRYGQKGKFGEPPSLERLRAELAARGMDPAAIDAQIARRNEARQRDGRFVRLAHGMTAPNNEQVRTRLERGGLASETINERLRHVHGSAGHDPRGRGAAQGGLGRIRR